jgi:DNA-binding GntR family transcriptional regulator
MKPSAARSTLAGEAYAVLRRRILTGGIPLGHAISRRRVAAELGMSFLPVSEAVVRLEMEGLVESRPRSGTRVCLPSPHRVLDHHVVRAALECDAARRFCQGATAAERAALRRLGERVDSLCARGDPHLYVTLHRRLHAAIARGAHCATLAAAIDRAQALALAWSVPAAATPAPWWRAEHAALAEIVAGAEPDAARDAMRHHLGRECDEILQALDRQPRAPGQRRARIERRARRQPLVPTAAAS